MVTKSKGKSRASRVNKASKPKSKPKSKSKSKPKSGSKPKKIVPTYEKKLSYVLDYIKESLEYGLFDESGKYYDKFGIEDLYKENAKYVKRLSANYLEGLYFMAKMSRLSKLKHIAGSGTAKRTDGFYFNKNRELITYNHDINLD